MKRAEIGLLCAGMASVLTWSSNAGAQAVVPQPPGDQRLETAYQAILTNAVVMKALEDVKADDARTLDEQKRIVQIPAPPFKEGRRAEYFLKRMHELGLKDVSIDTEGNVIGIRKGTGGKPKLVISAHLDTVFPEGTDVTVKEKDGAILAPGIGDDSRGLAAVLSMLKAMNENGLKTVGDVMFVRTVGEEELGNLRGVKALFRDHRTSTVSFPWTGSPSTASSIRRPAATVTR